MRVLGKKLTANNMACPFMWAKRCRPVGDKVGKWESKKNNKLYERLLQHSKSIQAVKNLETKDFVCRFMIFEGASEAMIAPVEAALIAKYRPLWNSVIDGFGNHNPGSKRFSGMVTQWDILHPGRKWAEKMTGERPDIKMLQRRVKDYMVGLR